MGVLSPRIVLLCSLVIILAVYLQQGEAWRRRIRIRVRRVIPTIRGRRIIRGLRRVVRRIRVRRVCVSVGRSQIRLSNQCKRGAAAAVYQREEQPIPTQSPVDPCSVIQSRANWGAPTVTPTQIFPITPVKKLALYVDGMNCTSVEACKAQARDLYTESKSYNFMIGTEGTVFEGKGWNNVSNHIDHYNVLEYGIGFIGDCIPSEVALDSVNVLVACGLRLAKIDADLEIGDDIILRFPDCDGK